MRQGLKPLGPVDKTAIAFRRYPVLHRLGRFLRNRVKVGLVSGFWEFLRTVLADFSFGPPKGCMSVYQMLRAKWPPLNGRIHLHDQGTPRVTGDCLMVRSGLNQYGEQPWPVLWSEHRQAELVGESLALLLPDKLLCYESAYREMWRGDPGARYLRLPPPVKLEGNWTSLVSYWCPTEGVPIYGHWTADALPRLGFLPEFPADTRILVPAQLSPVQREMLELWGVWDRCRPTQERHLLLEHYFFSSPTALIDCYDPYGRNVVRDALLPKRDRSYKGPKKFYLHRSGKRRSVANGEEICAFFLAKGWQVVVDVELNFAQTLTLFSEAEAICSFIGSNLSNTVFCSPGCTLMNMVTDSHIDGWIDWIAQEGKLDYHSCVFPVGGPFTPEIVVSPGLIEAFFAEEGVSF